MAINYMHTENEVFKTALETRKADLALIGAATAGLNARREVENAVIIFLAAWIQDKGLCADHQQVSEQCE